MARRPGRRGEVKPRSDWFDGTITQEKKDKMNRCHWDTSLSGWRRSHTQIALAFGTTFWAMALNLLVLGTILLWKRN
jgi:hypothetical protein